MEFNKKRIIILGCFVFGLLALLGISYSFFSYLFDSSNTNTISLGTISFNSSMESYTVTNLFPTEKANASDVATVSIQGSTTYEEGIEFVIKAVDINNAGNEYGIYPTINVDIEDIEGVTYTYVYSEENNTSLNKDTVLVAGKIAAGTGVPVETKIITISAFYDRAKYHITENTLDELENAGIKPDYVTSSTNLIKPEVWNSLVQTLTRTPETAYSFRIQVIATRSRISQLEEKYEFTYYSDMNSALGKANGEEVTDDKIVEKTDASIGVYTNENNVPVITLLEDVTITETLYPKNDVIIDLNGYTLTSLDPSKAPALDIAAELTDVDVVIEGSVPGSTFKAVRDGVIAKVLQPRTGTLTINGATIESYAVNGNAVPILGAADMTINDATIIATSVRNNVPDTTDIHAVGIQINGPSKTIANNTSFIANSDYIKSGSSYTGYGSGIRVMTGATAILNDCNAIGSHSGISNQGTVYIDGGIYESYGHGGVYFGGLNNIPTTSYVRNAIIRQSEMTEGFEAVHSGNSTGFYVGGSSTANYITVYLDNCDIYGSVDSFAIRDTKSEHDNNVYISNSVINTTAGARVDSSVHKLYIGSGNNFNGNNVSCRDQYDVTETYIDTNSDYSQIIDDAFNAILTE